MKSLFYLSLFIAVQAARKKKTQILDAAGDPGAGLVGAVADANNYCTWLPRVKGTTVALGEDDALPFCSSTNIAGTNGTQPLPSGFILSANYAEGTGYKQVSGCISPSAYGFDPLTDGGGQYDVLAPMGASMAGCSNFVNLIEPENYRWCIRCCQAGYESECDISVSTYGCPRVVPGDYTYGPNRAECTDNMVLATDPTNSTASSSASSSNNTAPASASSSASASNSSTTTATPSNVPASSSASMSLPQDLLGLLAAVSISISIASL